MAQLLDKDGRKGVCLTDLPWDDVLIPLILSHLPISTIFDLRQVNTKFQQIVDRYFETASSLDNSDP